MMRSMEAPLQELETYQQIRKNLEKPFACMQITGCADSQKLHLVSALAGDFLVRLIVTYSDQRVRELAEDARFYDRNVCVYPTRDLIFYQADVHSDEVTRERVKCLRRLTEKRPITIVTTFSALMTPTLPLSSFRDHIIHVDGRHPLDESTIAQRLVDMGYEKNYQVEAPGQFAIRGDIVDVFDATEENPYRIELWGDEVQSIRSFDILSQRSIEKLSSIELFPASEMILTEEELEAGMKRIQKDAKEQIEALRAQFKTEEAAHLKAQVGELKEQVLELHSRSGLESYIRYFTEEAVSFTDLLTAGKTCVFIDEPGHVKEHADAVELEFRESMSHRAEKGYVLPGQMDLLNSVAYTVAHVENMRRVGICSIPVPESMDLFNPETRYDLQARTVAPYNNSFETLVHDLGKYRDAGYRVLILSGSRTRAKRIVDDLLDQTPGGRSLTAFYSEDPGREIQPGEVMTYYGHIFKGFEYPEAKFAVIAESDIFNQKQQKKRRKKFKDGERIRDYAELKVGDYVVHENHGLGIYRGIEKIKSGGIEKDYIKVEYADGGNLYVLATGLDVLQKYASGGDDDAHKAKPRLNRLGSPDWERTKNRVRGAVEEIAQDLVELYAKRQAAQGHAFEKDTVWQQEFEDAFPYAETDDQLTAIEATKHDMESKRIMDRLVCGDVGFGKTEIAVRAAFKAVQDGKQVAVLVPTTILAQQHYNTFVDRMKDFPVTVGMLSRFRTAGEQKKTIEDLAKGRVDIIIGTHRLLSKDVKYKDLGLLVVDEEQRFGVTHKEKLKKLKENVDVLTLSATPIPRTLHMSLIGIRDMSLLEEAPNDRQPIQTFVCEYNDEMVREAIVRELSRKGQVYYVYNRISNIADIAAQLQKLVPEANVAFAHGRMQEHELEKIMYDFISGDIDVLVSTTIIETGLDIPNVNTMIIHDSDRMGLSQLYQLRGRVGRSNRTAYAFLMYKRGRLLREVAEKRLSAIREFTDLGSGYKIAMRDLEIRGAGNLLGQKQSGHMESVGYDMYCKLLGDAVRRAKAAEGLGSEEELQEEFVTSVDLDVDAYIPGTYILNEVQKLDIYKRIADCADYREIEEMRDELRDRFGEIPSEAENLLQIARIRIQAHRLFVSEMKGTNGRLSMKMRPDAQIHPQGIPKLLDTCHGALRLRTSGIPEFTYTFAEGTPEMLLTRTENLLTLMEQMLL